MNKKHQIKPGQLTSFLFFFLVLVVGTFLIWKNASPPNVDTRVTTRDTFADDVSSSSMDKVNRGGDVLVVSALKAVDIVALNKRTKAKNMIVIWPENGEKILLPNSLKSSSMNKILEEVRLLPGVETTQENIFGKVPLVLNEQFSIMPIVLGENTQVTKEFAKKLSSMCSKDCAILISAESAFADQENIKQLQRNYMMRKITTTSSGDSFDALLELLIGDKTSSLAFDQLTDGFLGYLEGEIDSKTRNTISFVIGGDMMFDRSIDFHFRDDKLFQVFDNFDNNLFKLTDLSLSNLEGPISPNPIKADQTAGNLSFNFPPKTTSVLKWLGINSVSLANNHTNNNGSIGLKNTKEMLGATGIVPIGQEVELTDNSVKTFKSRSGREICVIAVNVLETKSEVTSLIEKEKARGSYVIVFPHWGIEYEKTHSQSQEILAHKWIDSGADLIIGSHPHVIQDAEEYKGKMIFYSLGNFVFDQTFSEATQRGLIVAGEVQNDKTKLVLVPTKSVNYKPEVLQNDALLNFVKSYKIGGLNQFKLSNSGVLVNYEN